MLKIHNLITSKKNVNQKRKMVFPCQSRQKNVFEILIPAEFRRTIFLRRKFEEPGLYRISVKVKLHIFNRKLMLPIDCVRGWFFKSYILFDRKVAKARYKLFQLTYIVLGFILFFVLSKWEGSNECYRKYPKQGQTVLRIEAADSKIEEKIAI